MIFVLHQSYAFLPSELASLHLSGLGLTNELALAPYGIDDATDGLFEHRVRPADAMWLAAGSVAGLVWGLHDWAHFHNHGPFDQRAWTELQCDGTALAWLSLNRASIGVDEPTIARIEDDLVALSVTRFAEEGIDPGPVRGLLATLRDSLDATRLAAPSKTASARRAASAR
jgi:hypothetical protein